MKFTATFTPRSFQQTHLNLRQIAEKLGRTAKREAIAKAAQPLLKRARANVPKRFGFLRKSLKRRLRTYGDMIFVAIGPSRGPKLENPDGSGYSRPTNYAHLVEFGTSTTAARPFMRTAFEGGKKEAFDVYERDLKAAVKRVANRYNRKHPVK